MSSANIFTKLGAQFEIENTGKDRPDALTRYMGGQTRQNHPYVSGYWQFFVNVPPLIFPDNVDGDIAQWLHSTAEGFTPPSRTLNKADVPGQGGLGSSWVTGQTLTRTFTVTFREYQNLPMFGIINRWCSIIDPYTGVAPIDGDAWIPTSYKGSAYAILTKPVGGDLVGRVDDSMIEQVWAFSGIFPEGDGGDAFATDIATNDVAQLSITFSFDGWPLTKADAGTKVAALAHLNKKYGQTYTTIKAGIDVVGSVAGLGIA